MQKENLYLLGTLMTVSIVIYNYLLFTFIDKILEHPKLSRLFRIPVGIVNTAAAFLLIRMTGGSSLAAYLIIGLLLVINLKVWYRDNMLRVLFCSGACLLHLMCFRSMISAIFAMATKLTVYEVEQNTAYLLLSFVVGFAILDIVVLLVIKKIPGKSIKMINQHRDQIYFMTAWIAVFIIYMLMNAGIYNTPIDTDQLIINQLIAPLCILAGLYIVLFYTIRTGSLLGFKLINEELQQEYTQEKQYRESIARSALGTFEINYSKDLMLTGLEGLEKKLNYHNHTYSEVQRYINHSLVHPDDRKLMDVYIQPKYILEEYEQGERELETDFRMMDDSGTYKWVRYTSTLVKDSSSGDIRGYAFIKDIDKEKQQQLFLQYQAERDSLTGLYNKGTTEKLTEEYLSCQECSTNGCTLFIIDIDNFKAINDHLGHTYGDAVLCELAESLRSLFQKNAIVGRIGGDEFMISIKGQNIGIAKELAEQVRKAFYNTYKGVNKEIYIISSSIGIALCPKDGTRFDELYRHADTALYQSKNKGKNCYQFYEGTGFAGYEANRTEIRSEGQAIQKGFRQNRIEYVFKILYDSDSTISAIYAVLELLTSHFHFDRGYIFETSRDGKTTSNTFEWCAPGVEPQISNLQNMAIELVAEANASFYHQGTFIVKNICRMEESQRAVLEPQGIQSMFQFGIFNRDNLLGFIGFDNCRPDQELTDVEIEELTTICNILATFFAKQRLNEESEKKAAMLTAMLDDLESAAYVVDRDTFRLVFANQKTKEMIGSDDIAQHLCHNILRGKSEQCEDCPIRLLGETDQNRVTADIYNEGLDVWVRTTASGIDWEEGSRSVFINCVDITEYMKIKNKE